MRKKKKYFVGGAVTTGASALGASDSTAQGLGNLTDIGVGVGRLAAGDVSAVPGLLGTAGKTLMGGVNNSIGLMTNKNASFGDKALGALGMMNATNPLFSMVTGSRIDKLNQMAADDDQMNNIIKNNRMQGGGNIQRGNPNFKKDQAVLKAKFGVDPRIKQGSNGSYYMVGTAANTGSLVPDMSDWMMPGDTINTPVPQVDSTQIIPKNNIPDVNLKGLEEIIRIGNTPPEKFKRKTPKLFEGGGDLNEFNGGFTHSDQNLQNGFEGIPQGMSPDGGMNVVEKGETRWQDFIFSDKLKLDKNTATQLGFKKSDVGKTFADLSKKYSKESEDRPNDPITAKTLNIHMKNLMAANEQIKQTNEIGEVYKMAKGGKLNKYQGGSWLNSINPYQQVQTTPQQGIPFRYNTEIPTQQPVVNSTPQNTPTNYLNIQQIMQNMSPEERRSFTQNLAETKNPFGELTKMGYTPGGKGVSWQQSGAEPPFYGGVNAEILNQVSNPNLMNQVFGGTKDNYTNEDLQRLQREIMNDPNASQYVVNPEQTDFGVDWMVGSSMGPDFTAQPMTRKEPTLSITNDLGLAPMSPKQPPTGGGTEEEDKIKPPRNPPNLWPEAGALGQLGALSTLDPQYMTPNTMSTGYLRPQMIDEQTMRGSIDAANRANVGALANVTGGSGAAQRASLLGQGVNYMGATGNAFTQANQANNAARMQADQFNIGTQGNVASQNMGALNQANAMNTGIANQFNMETADTLAGIAGDYAYMGSARRKDKDMNKAISNSLWYDKFGNYVPQINNTDANIKACGGIIKTRKRNLK